MSNATLPPWIGTQLTTLLGQRGHAYLLHGPSGLGQYLLAMALARAWLCEQVSDAGACGNCPSCHAIDVRTHADLFVLMPETVLLERSWPLSEKAQGEIDDKKRKPSKEIRVEAMRDAVEFSQRTSAWGRGKVVLVFPAERMNHVTANALLKTLEEPAGDVRFVLASEQAHQLLPTIRSRCLGHAMGWPQTDQAVAWLQQQGVAPASALVCLRAAGGRPDDALHYAQAQREAAIWSLLPKAVHRGDPGLMQDWSAADILDALHKLCHDLQLQCQQRPPRFFDAKDLPKAHSFSALSQWGKDLAAARRTAEHPFQAGLMREALLSQARNVLNS